MAEGPDGIVGSQAGFAKPTRMAADSPARGLYCSDPAV